MKPILTTALALVMAASAAPALAQNGSYGSNAQQPAPTPPKGGQTAQQSPTANVKLSKQASNAIIALQDAVNKKDVANIPAKLAAAQAVAQTKDDHYMIARLQLQAAAAANDNAGMEAAMSAIAASNYLDLAHLSDLYVALGGTFYNNKLYPQAATAFQRALSINPQNADAGPMAAQALLQAGQKAEAAAAFQRLIQARIAAGQKADEDLYKHAVVAAYDAKSPMAIDLAREWVTAYPSPTNWSDAVGIYRNLNLSDVEATMDLLRLKQAMGLLSGDEYVALAANATDALIIDEAQAVVQEGMKANKINPASANAREVIGALATKAKPTAADLAAATKTAANAKALIRIGDNYAALGDYAHAVEAYKLAIAKPDGDASLANLHIGMALVRSGDKTGATTALNSVTGPRAGIAKYWLTYLSQKG